MDITYYRKMKTIERLMGTQKMRSYNLLEHCYMVTVLFQKFAKIENVSYDIDTIDLIMHHDIVEVETGDLIYTVKNFSSETKKHWEAIEEAIVSKHTDLQKYSDHALKTGLSKNQFSLFKACDLLDLWIFLKEEQKLGNKNRNLLEVTDNCVGMLYGKFNSIDKFMKSYVF